MTSPLLDESSYMKLAVVHQATPTYQRAEFSRCARLAPQAGEEIQDPAIQIQADYAEVMETAPPSLRTVLLAQCNEKIAIARAQAKFVSEKVSETVHAVDEKYQVSEFVSEHKAEIGGALVVGAALGGAAYAINRQAKEKKVSNRFVDSNTPHERAHVAGEEASSTQFRSQSADSYAIKTSVIQDVLPKIARHARLVEIDAPEWVDVKTCVITPICTGFWLAPAAVFEGSQYTRIQSIDDAQHSNHIEEVVGREKRVATGSQCGMVLIQLLTGGSTPDFRKFLGGEFTGGNVEFASVFGTAAGSDCLSAGGDLVIECGSASQVKIGTLIMSTACQVVGMVVNIDGNTIYGKCLSANNIVSSLAHLDQQMDEFRIRAHKRQKRRLVRGKNPLCAQAGEEYDYEATMGWMPNWMKWENFRPQGGSFYRRALQALGGAVQEVTPAVSTCAEAPACYAAEVRRNNGVDSDRNYMITPDSDYYNLDDWESSLAILDEPECNLSYQSKDYDLSPQSGEETIEEEDLVNIPVYVDRPNGIVRKSVKHRQRYMTAESYTILPSTLIAHIQEVNCHQSLRSCCGWLTEGFDSDEFDSVVTYTQAFKMPLKFLPHSSELDQLLSILSRDPQVHRHVMMSVRALIPREIILPTASLSALTDILCQWLFHLGYRASNYNHSFRYFMSNGLTNLEFLTGAACFARACFGYKGDEFPLYEVGRSKLAALF